MFLRPIAPHRSAAGALTAFLLAAAAAPTHASDGGRIVGQEAIYTIQPGDSLARIGARFGLDPRGLARNNGLSPQARLTPATTLKIDNRHVVPRGVEDGILINVPQRLLFLFREGALVAWYPVGLGRPDWPTAVGSFRVASTEHNPTWHVPISIQQEMRRSGRPVRKEVPPGPANPLGDYWMGLSGSGCGIHGTNAPTSIYAFHTHGCIRLHPADIADLVGRVRVGTPVWIGYEPVLLERTADGPIFLEVNADIYRRAPRPRSAVDALAALLGIAADLDPARVAEVLNLREGLARRVDLGWRDPHEPPPGLSSPGR